MIMITCYSYEKKENNDINKNDNLAKFNVNLRNAKNTEWCFATCHFSSPIFEEVVSVTGEANDDFLLIMPFVFQKRPCAQVLFIRK